MQPPVLRLEASEVTRHAQLWPWLLAVFLPLALADLLIRRWEHVRGPGPATAGEGLRHGLTLGVESSRVLVLIGPSGGGKSTPLRVLGGLEPADAGRVQVNDHALAGAAPEALQAYRRRNGFVFQQFYLFPHLTARRTITLLLEKVHGQSPEQAAAMAETALARFGLLDHAGKLPSQLSGGQQQRVGIARAIAVAPEVLFPDEPTSALDPEMTAEVLELIQDLAEAGQDIILSTHEMGFARAVADRVAFVAAGRIEEGAPLAELFGAARSAGVQRFLSRVMRY